MNTYRDLKIWQKSMILITDIYNVSSNFPKTEVYSLTAQIRRSAVSVPSNIAEGYGRNGKKDYLRFLNIAMASLFELQTQLEISKNLEYINESKFEVLWERSREVERMLSSYIRKIED